MIAPQDLARLLSKGRFDLSNEKATQAGIEAWLADHLPADCALSREHRLSPRNIPDFLVGGCIVVEVKSRHIGKAATLYQLARYAEHEAVTALIFISNTAVDLPATLNGKPVLVVSLGRGWL